jgi:hypothetical protein
VIIFVPTGTCAGSVINFFIKINPISITYDNAKVVALILLLYCPVCLVLEFSNLTPRGSVHSNGQ